MSARDEFPQLRYALMRATTNGPFYVECRAAMDEIDRLRAALAGLAEHEDQPCRFDHHGYCQEHPGGFGPSGCGVAIARKALGLPYSPIRVPQ